MPINKIKFMKYKEGDKVRIKSLDWYYEKCDDFGNVDCGFYYFTKDMSEFCGKEITIETIYRNGRFSMIEDSGKYIWTSEMFECINEDSKIGIWLAIDKNGRAHLYRTKPYRDGEQWRCYSTKEIPFPVLPVELYAVSMWLNKTKLRWEDEPIELNIFN